MRKFLLALGAAALLSLPIVAHAAAVPQATVVENTVAGGMDAAGEVSGTIIVEPFTTLSIFWGGTYSAGNRFELQEETGSPHSGAFRKVWRLDTATANADSSTTFLTGPNRTAYRVFMTVAGTGDVLVTMTDASRTPNAFTDKDLYLRHFDDFNTQTTAVDAAHYVAGDEGAGTLAVVTVTIEEGGVTQVTDTNNDATDAVCFGSIVVTDKAGLVSDGWMSFEARVRQNEVGAELTHGVGLMDVVCALNTDDQPVNFSALEGTVNGATDGAFVLQDGAATDTTSYTPFSVNAGVEQHDIDTANTAYFYDTKVDPVDDNYNILRVEIDASGDAFFYIDGALVFAEATAVATTGTLAPFIFVNSINGNSTTITQVIDYWLHTITRPSDAT